MVLVTAFGVLVPTAWACHFRLGPSWAEQQRPARAWAEILYAFSSGTGNNGSAFAGLTCAPTPAGGLTAGTVGDRHWDTILGVVILFGRFFMIIPVHGAGRQPGEEESDSQAKRRQLPRRRAAPSSFLLIGTVIIVGALTFFPVLSLSPVRRAFPDDRVHRITVLIGEIQSRTEFYTNAK